MATRGPRRGAPRDAARHGPDGGDVCRRGRRLRFIEEDRERKPPTLRDYRSALNAHLLPAFGDQPLEAITPEQIEAWRRSLAGLSNRSKNKLLIELHGIFRRAQMVWSLPANPLARGGLGARPGGGGGAGRRSLSDGGVHWAEDGGAVGVVLA